MAKRYQELLVWQRAMEVVKDIYRLTAVFPVEERFGLTSQIRRAAISLPSNIAEGQGRLTKGEFRHFLGQARGSVFELETQLILSADLHYAKKEEVEQAIERTGEVSKMLNGLTKSLETGK